MYVAEVANRSGNFNVVIVDITLLKIRVKMMTTPNAPNEEGPGVPLTAWNL